MSHAAPPMRLASNAKTLPAREPIQQIAQAQAAEVPAPSAATPAIGTCAGGARSGGAGSRRPDYRAGSEPARPQYTGAERRRRKLKPAAPAPKSAATASNIPACDKPGGMGLSRIVEIDTTGGPGFGFEHFKQYDFLRDKEVVLTFDDGPWPGNTPAVLKALADECLKATFFEIGEHAMWHPEIAKEVAAAGMTIGSHTWSHKDLAQEPLRQRSRTGQAGDRDGHQRRAHGASTHRSRRSSAFRTCSIRRR